MKMNKKGFTLIEMLVVIAIIAVLVAIIVPTVSKATNKAKYAADAANLRSAAAECAIYHLSNEADDTHTCGAGTCWTAFTPKIVTGAVTIAYDETTGEVTAKIGSYTAAQIGEAAESGNLS